MHRACSVEHDAGSMGERIRGLGDEGVYCPCITLQIIGPRGLTASKSV